MSDTHELKPEPWGVHLLGLGPVLSVIAGNIAGGPWVLAGIVYMLGVGPVLDVAFGRRRELTRYKTALDGLYLCGAGTYPGAGIWGSSGRNAAARVAADLAGKGA